MNQSSETFCRTRDFLVTKKGFQCVVKLGWDKVSSQHVEWEQTKKNFLNKKDLKFRTYESHDQKQGTGHINTTSGQLRPVALGNRFLGYTKYTTLWTTQNVPWRLSMAIRDSYPRVKKRKTYTKKNVTESKAGRQRSPKQDLVSTSSSDASIFLGGNAGHWMIWDISVGTKHPQNNANFPPIHSSSRCHPHQKYLRSTICLWGGGGVV